MALNDLRQSRYQGRFLIEEPDPKSKAVQDGAEKALDALSRSIAEAGVLQPIIVRPHPEGGYEIVDGYRRVAACRRLSRELVPAIVRECDERQMQIMSVVANLQRKNLTTIELAVTYQKLPDRYGEVVDKKLSRILGCATNL